MTECPSCHAVLAQPAERFCPNCGIDLATVAPAAPYAPPPGAGYAPPQSPPPYGGVGAGTPWERRGQIGFFNALVETTKQVLSEPAAFFRAMPVAGGLGGPLLYAIIVGFIGVLASAIYSGVFRGVLSDSLARMGGNEDLARFTQLLRGGSVLATVIFGPVVIVLRVFLGSGLIHLALLLMGGGQRGYEATFRVAAYSQAASIFSIVPLCGGLVEGIFGIVLLIIGVSEAQGIGRGKAAVAVLVPGLVLCCCCAGALAAFFFGIAGMASHLR